MRAGFRDDYALRRPLRSSHNDGAAHGVLHHDAAPGHGATLNSARELKLPDIIEGAEVWPVRKKM